MHVPAVDINIINQSQLHEIESEFGVNNVHERSSNIVGGKHKQSLARPAQSQHEFAQRFRARKLFARADASLFCEISYPLKTELLFLERWARGRVRSKLQLLACANTRWGCERASVSGVG
jgi:hypothetical protein